MRQTTVNELKIGDVFKFETDKMFRTFMGWIKETPRMEDDGGLCYKIYTEKPKHFIGTAHIPGKAMAIGWLTPSYKVLVPEFEEEAH